MEKLYQTTTSTNVSQTERSCVSWHPQFGQDLLNVGAIQTVLHSNFVKTLVSIYKLVVIKDLDKKNCFQSKIFSKRKTCHSSWLLSKDWQRKFARMDLRLNGRQSVVNSQAGKPSGNREKILQLKFEYVKCLQMYNIVKFVRPQKSKDCGEQREIKMQRNQKWMPKRKNVLKNNVVVKKISRNVKLNSQQDLQKRKHVVDKKVCR